MCLRVHVNTCRYESQLATSRVMAASLFKWPLFRTGAVTPLAARHRACDRIASSAGFILTRASIEIIRHLLLQCLITSMRAREVLTAVLSARIIRGRSARLFPLIIHSDDRTDGPHRHTSGWLTDTPPHRRTAAPPHLHRLERFNPSGIMKSCYECNATQYLPLSRREHAFLYSN